MDSKKSINLIFFVFFVFLVHLFLYYFIPSYALYFKDIKYKKLDNNIETQELSNKKNVEIKGVSSYTGSNYIIPDINGSLDEKNINTAEVKDSLVGEKLTNNNEVELTNKDSVKDISNEKEYFSSDKTGDLVEQEVLGLFKDFNLVEKEKSENSSLFGLTNEYPYEYKEFYSKEKKMTLYIFEGKLYDDILNIFDVISYNLYFKIKKVNNFGDKSFFINLEPDLDDNYIRFVFSYKNKNFGLKIKKDGYNDVKVIMKSLGKN
ncbi:MAG: hypothetical protein WC850_00290 [Candidatus Gracilibacteria bacterium]